MVFGIGCQSTSHRFPTEGSSPASVNRQVSSPPQIGLRADPLIEILDRTSVLYSNGSLNEAKVTLRGHLGQFGGADFGVEASFRQQFLHAALIFYDDPWKGLDSARRLTPANYNEAAAVAVLRAHVFSKAGNCEATIDELATFEPVGLHDSQEWSRRIWNVMADWCVYRCDSVNTTQSEAAKGWWAVGKIAREAVSQSQRNLLFGKWRESNPDHLAAIHPPGPFQLRAGNPTNVALLLPQSGPLASAARAIRNGFFGTHLFHLQTAAEVKVRVYDTQQTDVLNLVDKAIAEGADVIVGPLDKDRVRSVVQGDSLPIPTIALNRVPSAQINNASSLQLAIAVEDDIVKIVAKLNDMRARKVLLFIGGNYWSARASVWLKSVLLNDMQIVDEIVLNNLAEVTEDTAEILHVGQSNRRHEALEAKIGKLEFTPRRRHDVDAVVALVDHSEFASLTAALHYHFAGDLPLLVAEPTFRNRQLEAEYANGTLYTSIPANLYSTALTNELLGSFTESESLFPLYAFGSDAYRVAMNIRTLERGFSVFGLTGVLSVKHQGVLTRQPVWGMVDNQELVPAVPVHKPTERLRSLM